MIVDPGQFDIGTAVSRLGDLMDRVDDPTADDQFESLLTIPAVRALFAPRMVTHGVTSVREFCGDLLRYTNAETVTLITYPSFVTDNESDQVSTGQGRVLFEHLTGEKTFRLFTKAEGADAKVTINGAAAQVAGLAVSYRNADLDVSLDIALS